MAKQRVLIALLKYKVTWVTEDDDQTLYFTECTLSGNDAYNNRGERGWSKAARIARKDAMAQGYNSIIIKQIELIHKDYNRCVDCGKVLTTPYALRCDLHAGKERGNQRWAERRPELAEIFAKSDSYQDVADELGVSRQRAYQLGSKYDLKLPKNIKNDNSEAGEMNHPPTGTNPVIEITEPVTETG